MNNVKSSDRHSTATLTTADLARASRRELPQPDESENAVAARARASTDENPESEELAPLFDSANAQEFRSRWSIVQQGFVDDPAKAVREGDELVAQVIKSLAETFAQQRDRLEGKEGSTEDLRLALRRYRSFFDRLLSI